METRLVVGCGSVGYDLVSALADRPGTVSVLEENERRVERLREEGVAATHVDRLDCRPRPVRPRSARRRDHRPPRPR
nr:NAD-binding protein [Halorientalis regularis]